MTATSTPVSAAASASRSSASRCQRCPSDSSGQGSTYGSTRMPTVGSAATASYTALTPPGPLPAVTSSGLPGYGPGGSSARRVATVSAVSGASTAPFRSAASAVSVAPPPEAVITKAPFAGSGRPNERSRATMRACSVIESASQMPCSSRRAPSRSWSATTEPVCDLAASRPAVERPSRSSTSSLPASRAACAVRATRSTSRTDSAMPQT